MIQPIAKFGEKVFSKEYYDKTVDEVVKTWNIIEDSYKQWWKTVQRQLESALTATKHFFVHLWLKTQSKLRILWEAIKAFCVRMWNNPIIRTLLIFGLSSAITMIIAELGVLPIFILANVFPLVTMIFSHLLEPNH